MAPISDVSTRDSIAWELPEKKKKKNVSVRSLPQNLEESVKETNKTECVFSLSCLWIIMIASDFDLQCIDLYSNHIFAIKEHTQATICIMLSKSSSNILKRHTIKQTLCPVEHVAALVASNGNMTSGDGRIWDLGRPAKLRVIKAPFVNISVKEFFWFYTKLLVTFFEPLSYLTSVTAA